MILVDSSVWVAFFKGKEDAKPLRDLLKQQQVVMSDVVLAELLPLLMHQGESELVSMLQALDRVESEIDWHEITQMQYKNIANGINKVGIPDLMLAYQARQHQLTLYTLDKHFKLMQPLHGFELLQLTKRI